MKQNANIDAYLSQYEDLLGEKLEDVNIEEEDVELDPEMKRLQQLLAK